MMVAQIIKLLQTVIDEFGRVVKTHLSNKWVICTNEFSFPVDNTLKLLESKKDLIRRRSIDNLFYRSH